MTNNKIVELNEIYNSVDQRKKILAELAVDYVMVKKQIEQKMIAKDKLEIELTKMQKVNEIHIEIDVLQSSKEGQ